MKKILLTSIAALAVTGVTSTVMAEEVVGNAWQQGAQAVSSWMDDLAKNSEWDRNNSPVTGYGVDQIMGILDPVFEATLTTDNFDSNFKEYLKDELDHKKVDPTNYALDSTKLTYDKDQNTFSTTSSVEGYNLTSGSEIDKNKYSYKDYEGNVVSYSAEGAQTVTTTGTYGSGNGKQLSYTADLIGHTDDAILDATLYGFGEGTSAENMITYSLSDDMINSTTRKQGTIYMQKSGEDKVAVGEYSFKTSDEKAITIKFNEEAGLSTATTGKLTEMIDQYKTDAKAWNGLMATADSNFAKNQQNYEAMLDTIDTDQGTLDNLNDYADDMGEYTGTLAQMLDDSYGKKLSQTLGYDVALKNITDADVLGKDVVTAIKDNTTAISAEAETRWTIDESLYGMIKNEVTARDTADKALQSAIDSEYTRAVSAEDQIKYDLSVEVTARDTADAALQSAINSEYTRAVSAEDQIKYDLSVEVTARDTADKALQSALQSETDDRIAMDELVRQESYRVVNNETEARKYADDQLAQAMAESYTELQSGIDANAAAISSLNQKVDTIEKDLSAGIASATALSSVAVANVKKGEVSIGGGYGNYNARSAMAFGAAVGISDSWSVNAGAGMGFGNTTKASFRVGTNYKFKLF